jgi:AcrR family transcriptional regulator
VEELAKAAGISKGAFYAFYDSKEALFMVVLEQAEKQFREEILSAVEEPGPTPRARLIHALTRAKQLWHKLPILQFFTQSDFVSMLRKIPQETFAEHQRADDEFLEAFILRCTLEGIPIQLKAEELSPLIYALFLLSMHEDDPLPVIEADTVNVFIDLVAARCLGEV